MQQIVNNCLKAIVKYPKTVLMILALIGGFFSTWLDDFQLDASSDSLLLEDDLDLRYYRNIKARYGDDEFLVVTYQPKGDLFSQETKNKYQHLQRISHDKIYSWEKTTRLKLLVSFGLSNWLISQIDINWTTVDSTIH